MMITIHGRANSANVQAVMWAVAELGLKHERLDVGGGFGGNNEPSYLAKNPMGLVPVLEEDGLVMFESNAIVRYLVNRHDGKHLLSSTDYKQNALADTWMEWSKTTVYPVIIPGFFWNLVRVKKADRDPAKMQGFQEQQVRLMAMADAQIGKGKWLAGDQMSIADIGFGTMLYRYFTLEIDRPSLPNLERYYQQLTGRPAYRDHVMIDYSSMRVE